MRRSRGSVTRAVLMACGLAIAVAFVLPATDASAYSQPIPTTVSLLKWGGSPRVGKLYKIVSKGAFTLPAPGSVSSGSVLVTVGTKTLECDLTKATWKGLGNPAGSKGWKYVYTAAPSGDLCKVVIVKAAVIKVLAKGVGSIDLPLASGNPDVSLDLVVGADSYCALATGPHALEKADTIIKMLGEAAPPSCAVACDCTGKTQYSLFTGIPSAVPARGTVSNYRCSNNASGACAENTDCDFGSCYITPPVCSGNTSVACDDNGDCVGTCAEVVAGNLPLDLEAGSLYTGGGLNTVTLPVPLPDNNLAYYTVSTVDGQTLTLGETTPAQAGARHCTKGRTCSVGGAQCVVDADCSAGTCLDNCNYDAPLPIPNTTTPATSVCVVNVVAEDASGTAQCTGGDTDILLPLRAVVHLTGDLFKASTPPDIPGVQPCPLCQGGTVGVPASGTCLGGPNNGLACEPATSDSGALGDPENAFPTSLDCPPDPLADITANIGGLPIDFNLTTGTQTINAEDRPQGARVFCGYCRDVSGAGSLCFEGDTSGSCPAAIPPATGEAVACNSDADCTADGDEYESCVQRDPGAFSEAAATRLTATGSSSGCLGDGNPHLQNQVSIFCIPPTFDATVDAAGDLPGPGASLLYGEVELQ